MTSQTYENGEQYHLKCYTLGAKVLLLTNYLSRHPRKNIILAGHIKILDKNIREQATKKKTRIVKILMTRRILSKFFNKFIVLMCLKRTLYYELKGTLYYEKWKIQLEINKETKRCAKEAQ